MTDIIYWNGSFVSEREARIEPADRGFTLGDGVFDTMLAIDGEPVWGPEHSERLKAHAKILKIAFTLDIEATATVLLEKNSFKKGRYAIRTTVTRGPGERGLAPPETQHPTIIMRASPAPEAGKTVSAAIARSVRRNEHSPLSRIKSLNYGDNLLALLEAKERGADEAIMLNTAGNVCCASASNIFIKERGKFFTPPLEDGLLNGISRAKFMAEHKAAEESISEERLRAADAVKLTNSILGTRQVSGFKA